jgi:hypothetical protein
MSSSTNSRKARATGTSCVIRPPWISDPSARLPAEAVRIRGSSRGVRRSRVDWPDRAAADRRGARGRTDAMVHEISRRVPVSAGYGAALKLTGPARPAPIPRRCRSTPGCAALTNSGRSGRETIFSRDSASRRSSTPRRRRVRPAPRPGHGANPFRLARVRSSRLRRLRTGDGRCAGSSSGSRRSARCRRRAPAPAANRRRCDRRTSAYEGAVAVNESDALEGADADPASDRMSIAVPRIRPLPRTAAAIYGFTRCGSGDCPVARAGAALGDRARHVVPLAA